MKKTGLLNAPLSAVIAELGHAQGLCIADAGLPIHQTQRNGRIDLALSPSVPSFLQVLEAVLLELKVERVVLAEEIKRHNPQLKSDIISLIYKRLDRQSAEQIRFDYISHEEFKTCTQSCRAIVRSGECSPYANIILYSGVVF